MKKINYLFIILFLFISPVFSSEKTIVLATLDWEPYIGKNLKKQGYVAQIVKESFNRVGYKVQFKFYPWSRSLMLAKLGVVDGYFPEYYSKKVESHSKFSKPFKGGPLGFFKNSTSTINYKKLEDLKSYKIGVVKDYINTLEFDNASYLKKESVSSDILNVRKLLAGRIDLFVADKFVALHLLEQDSPNKKSQLEFIEPALEIKELYVCISNLSKNADIKLYDFNKGLEQIKKDGTLNQIMKEHGF